MAAHSSILAWKISWTEEPGGLQSIGSQRVGYLTFLCRCRGNSRVRLFSVHRCCSPKILAQTFDHLSLEQS